MRKKKVKKSNLILNCRVEYILQVEDIRYEGKKMNKSKTYGERIIKTFY